MYFFFFNINKILINYEQIFLTLINYLLNNQNVLLNTNLSEILFNLQKKIFLYGKKYCFDFQLKKIIKKKILSEKFFFYK
jgi:hypothetical protein